MTVGERLTVTANIGVNDTAIVTAVLRKGKSVVEVQFKVDGSTYQFQNGVLVLVEGPSVFHRAHDYGREAVKAHRERVNREVARLRRNGRLTSLQQVDAKLVADE